jgi:predicted TIM-barrel fold metal-dependent hydrolase
MAWTSERDLHSGAASAPTTVSPEMEVSTRPERRGRPREAIKENDMPDLFDRYKVIDVDTHVTEPRDVWTSRVASKWGDRVPHVVRMGAIDMWMIGDQPILPAGITAMAGFDGFIPDFPKTYEDAVTASYDAKARLEHMDREGIYAQVLYPNLGGFGSARFLALKEPELMLECVRAYNDWLVEWSSAAPKRLLPIMATPFWDLDAAVDEIQRCAKTGHKGILFGSQPETFGQPVLVDPHWDPLWATAQDVGLPISFHIGSGDNNDLLGGGAGLGIRTHMAKACTQLFMDNSNCIADLIFGGICHRFPELDFVSVESGASWVIFAVEAFDWQWLNNGVTTEHPEYDLLPSEYFKRQIYACFWFEQLGVQRAIELFPDNMMFETDYPHPTSMSPGPKSTALRPRDYAEKTLGGLPEHLQRKVLESTAARVYNLD